MKELSEADQQELVDLFTSTKYYQRMIADVAADHPANEDGEYPLQYWNKVDHRMRTAITEFATMLGARNMKAQLEGFKENIIKVQDLLSTEKENIATYIEDLGDDQEQTKTELEGGIDWADNALDAIGSLLRALDDAIDAYEDTDEDEAEEKDK